MDEWLPGRIHGCMRGSVKYGSASNIYIYIDLPVQDRTVPVPALTGASTRSTAVPVVMIGKYRDS